MKIGFVLNDPDTEHELAATTVLMHAASRLGHDVYALDVHTLNYFADGHVGGVARVGPVGTRRSQKSFLDTLKGKSAKREEITSEELDVLWLRYNPLDEIGENAWAEEAGILFGQAAARMGVIVLNHPTTLAHALKKFYLQHFPESVRPATMITRDPARVEQFLEEHDRRIIVKPLTGYGGADVYLFKGKADNLKQVVESLSRSGYVIAQEYLPEAVDGDTRLFLVNGAPLVVDGKVAALRRVNATGDFRSNMTAGGKPAKAKVTDEMLEMASMVGAKLRKDGIFFAGLDVVGGKLIEINTISAGGLNAASRLEEVDFGAATIRCIERKVEYKRHYGSSLSNQDIAGMP